MSTDERQLTDMKIMAKLLERLSHLRAHAANMAPLEVASATLPIGRRLGVNSDDAVSDVERRIEAAIRAVVATIEDIAAGRPYDMDVVRPLMAKLRDDIAADGVLDAFDATPAGQSAKLLGVPDDARSLMAYRANPVEKVAEIATNQSVNVLCTSRYGYVSAGEVYYELNRRSSFIQTGRPTDASMHGMVVAVAVNFADRFHVVSGPNSQWVTRQRDSGSVAIRTIRSAQDIVVSTANEVVLMSGSYMIHVTEDFDSIARSLGYAGGIKILAWKVDNDGNANRLIVGNTRHGTILRGKRFLLREDRMAVDADGNLWCICWMPGQWTYVVVYNQNGAEIAQFDEAGVRYGGICAGIGCVWIGIERGSQNYIVQYRLAPSAAYNAGMSAAAV